MPRRFWHLGLLAGLGLLLAACTNDIRTTVNADGSGEARLEFAFSQDEFETMQQVLEEQEGTRVDDPEEMCATFIDMTGLAGDLEVQQRGGSNLCTVTVEFDDLDELKRLYDAMGVVTDELAIDEDAGRFVYAIQLDMAGASDEPLQDFDQTYRWHITTPGRVVDSNAQRQSGQTLTWDLALEDGMKLEAESTLAAAQLDNMVRTLAVMGAVCCGVLLLGAVGAGAFFLSRRRQVPPPPPVYPAPG